MQQDIQHDEDGGKDSTNEMLQKEKMIDPGNEHTHQNQDDNKIPGTEAQRQKHDADAGANSTGTAGPEPGYGKNDAPDTSGEDG